MALVTLDEVDPNTHFRQRAAVMKSVPQFLRGLFRNALKLVFEEATWGNSRDDELRQERGWKFFMLLPRIEWIRASKVCKEKAASARQRQRRRWTG